MGLARIRRLQLNSKTAEALPLSRVSLAFRSELLKSDDIFRIYNGSVRSDADQNKNVILKVKRSLLKEER